MTKTAAASMTSTNVIPPFRGGRREDSVKRENMDGIFVTMLYIT
jgi:hypothetical protein